MELASAVLVAIGSLAGWCAFQLNDIRGWRGLAAASVAWFLGAALLAVPYARRWGGSRRDGVLLTVTIWLLMALPAAVLPFMRHPDSLPFVSAFLYAVTLAYGFQNQGRYLHIQRSLPPLEGEARAVAENVIRSAGLDPVALFVAPFPCFNAVVVGLRKCIVIIDRRMSREMPAGELAALVGHEASHIVRSDVLKHLAIPAASLACAHVIAAWRDDPSVILPVFIGLYVGIGVAVFQRSELQADRAAVALTGAAETGRMLHRVHADRPKAFDRAASAPLLTAFLSHPSLDVRLAVVEGRGLPPAHHLGALVRSLLGLMPLIVALWVAKPHPALLWSPSVAILLLYVAARFVLIRSVTRSFGVITSQPSRGRTLTWWFAWPLAVSVLIVLAGHRFPEMRRFVVGAAVLCFVVAMGALLLALVRGAFRSRLSMLPSQLRNPVLNALAAASEERGEEGLTRLDAVPEKYRRAPWFLTAKGTCLLSTGRIQEAAAVLKDAVGSDLKFPLPQFNLGVCQMIAGNASDAMAAFAAVGRQVPWDPMVWTMVGETCLEMGDLRGAQEAFERALDLRPADPAALAGLLHVAIEEGSEDKAETRLRAAEAAAPRSAPVLLARARWHKASGRADEAMAAFAESLTRLHGGAAWRSRYESLASRWGIVPPNVPSTPQPTNDGAAQA